MLSESLLKSQVLSGQCSDQPQPIDGVNVNELMVHEGFADVDQRYADQCEWSKHQS